MADIFPPLENWTHRLHSVVNPVHGKQCWEGAWYASSSRFEGASPVYRLASLALRPSVVGTYQVHGMHEKTKLLMWIWVRWSWIIFLIIIFDNICRVVGVSQSVSCYVHTSLTLRQISRTRRWANVLQAFLQGERLQNLVEQRFGAQDVSWCAHLAFNLKLMHPQ